MSQGGLPTIYRQEGGLSDEDYAWTFNEAGGYDYASDPAASGSYQDQWEEAMSRESAPIQSRSTRTPGLSELGYSADEIADIRAVQADELRGDRDREDTGPSTWDEVKSWWRGDDLNINNLARNQMLGRVGLKSWKGEEPPWDSDYKMQDALPIPQRSVGGYPYWDDIKPSGGFGTATEASDLAQLAAAQASANKIDYKDPKTWTTGYDPNPAPPSKTWTTGYDPNAPTAALDVNIGMGPKYGSSGEDRPIDSYSPSNDVTDERYKSLYGPKGPNYTETGQFIYNPLGGLSLGPKLTGVENQENRAAIKRRLNEKGYEKSEYVYLNDLMSKGYNINQAEDILVAAIATPGGLAAMQAGFKDGYSYGGPAGTLLDALEKGTQHTIGISDILKRKKEDKIMERQAQGELQEKEINKEDANDFGIGKFFGFFTDLFGGKNKEGAILTKDDIPDIRQKIVESDSVYTPPNQMDGFLSSILGSSIPLQILQAIIPTKSIGTITTQNGEGSTFSLNEDGSLTYIDLSNLNYDEGHDIPEKRRRSRPVQQAKASPVVEPEKTGMAALLAKRRKPTDRLELADNISGQDKFKKIYGRNYRTV